MITLARTIFLGFLLLSLRVMADAPVIDDSENFALLEEQQRAQAVEELPVAHESYTIRDDDAETPLAQDTMNTAKNIELLNKIQVLQQDLQELRGQLEIQAHELNELKQQQLSFYQDLDARLNHTALTDTESQNQVPKQTMPLTQTGPTPTEVMQQAENETANTILKQNTGQRLNPADEQISYLAAYELIKQKQGTNAAIAMYQFLNKYPHGGYSANAHYWLGELYLEKKDYTSAISQFETILQTFKSSSKCASSHLKLGYALAESGHISEAKKHLLTVMKQYPDTAVARLAQTKLESMGG
jgi:tol-pal system protein YbgF